MNMLDQHYRTILCNDQVFMSVSNMEATHPSLEGLHWSFVSHGEWMMDPHTGEAKLKEDWQLDWLNDDNPAWEGLSWDEVERSLMPVVVDVKDPEGKTFLSHEMAMEMMKACDKDLMESLKKDPCLDASLQDVWDAFWTYQEIRELKQEVKEMQDYAYAEWDDENLDAIYPEMQNR